MDPDPEAQKHVDPMDPDSEWIRNRIRKTGHKTRKASPTWNA
jgi:hypothetical protein